MNYSRSNHLLLSVLLVCFLAGITFIPHPPAAAQEPAHVLMIHSYDPAYTWEISMINGITEGLANAGYSEEAGNLVLDHFWMDTNRHPDLDYLTQITFEAVQLIKDTQPDIVILSDDNAVRLVSGRWDGDDIPFVFVGLNGKPSNYGIADMPNVTGVLERAHFEETLAWIHYVLPDAKRVTVLADNSYTASTYSRELQMALDGSEFFDETYMYTTSSFLEWQQIVTDIVVDSDVLLIGTYSALSDMGGNSMSQQAVMSWTASISRVPIVSLWDFGVMDGALGGSVISARTQGTEAGAIVAEILAGTPPSEIPYVAPSRGSLVLNLDAIERWDVAIPLNLLEISDILGPDAPPGADAPQPDGE